MSAVALQGLLDYLLDTLSVSNRKWLAEHLIEPTCDDVRPYTREELIADTEEAVADFQNGNFCTEDQMHAKTDALLEQWKQTDVAYRGTMDFYR